MSPGLTVAGIGFPKWRTRTKFHMIDALDGQMHGRWFYGGIHDKQDRSVKVNITCGVLPVEVASFETECVDDKTVLKFLVLSQENVAQYKISGSENGIDFVEIRILSPEISGAYEIEMPTDLSYNYVLLSVIDNNGHMTDFVKKINYCHTEQSDLSVYPNPSSHSLNLHLEGSDELLEEVRIIDLAGKIVHKASKYSGSIDVSMLPPGIYYVFAETKNGKTYSSKFSHL
jgi:Secretion system C-terminal sorting domain